MNTNNYNNNIKQCVRLEMLKRMFEKRIVFRNTVKKKREVILRLKRHGPVERRNVMPAVSRVRSEMESKRSEVIENDLKGRAANGQTD